MNSFNRTGRQAGFSMLEILVTILILLIGLLGLAGLQTRAHTAELESYQRVQALILGSKMVDLMRTHHTTVPCFAITDASTGEPYVGADGPAHNGPIACAASTAAENLMADAAMDEWDSALLGAAESKGGVDVGAMIGARGCVSYDAATELIDPATGGVISGTGVYTVAVSWQGLSDTITPATNCANGLYGSEGKRRTISMTFRQALLR
jgi:type IV pilus assembly protein PilV